MHTPADDGVLEGAATVALPLAVAAATRALLSEGRGGVATMGADADDAAPVELGEPVLEAGAASCDDCDAGTVADKEYTSYRR